MPSRIRKTSGLPLSQASTQSTTSQRSSTSGKSRSNSKRRPMGLSSGTASRRVVKSALQAASERRTTPGTGRLSAVTATSGGRQIVKHQGNNASTSTPTTTARAPRGMSNRSFHNGSSVKPSAVPKSASSKSKASKSAPKTASLKSKSKTPKSKSAPKPKSGAATATGSKSKSTKSPSSARSSGKSVPRRTQLTTEDDDANMPSSRLYKVPKKTADKWAPLSDATLKHMDGVIDYAISAVLSESVSTITGHYRVDAEKEMLTLKAKMLTALRKTHGPPVPKRRKLAYQDLAGANRKREEVLFGTHRHVANLQTELATRRRALADAEAHLQDYTERMEAGETYHKRERVGTLHPTLRRALRLQERNQRQIASRAAGDAEDSNAETANKDATIAAITEGGTTVEDGTTSVVDVLSAFSRQPTAGDADGESDSDGELDAIVDRVCAKLSDAQPDLQKYLSWLDLAHKTVGMLSDKVQQKRT